MLAYKLAIEILHSRKQTHHVNDYKDSCYGVSPQEDSQSNATQVAKQNTQFNSEQYIPVPLIPVTTNSNIMALFLS